MKSFPQKESDSSKKRKGHLNKIIVLLLYSPGDVGKDLG
jgi:hypothetical protein